uniref:Uncharacterized protein n=1 Tax=Physcomitrium patens TaxID=3218 RepID=A0A2K1L4B3_PHYPA|nr:hypothetical protein PHYPA_003663 [Physcomitrium patens]
MLRIATVPPTSLLYSLLVTGVSESWTLRLWTLLYWGFKEQAGSYVSLGGVLFLVECRSIAGVSYVKFLLRCRQCSARG